MLYVVSGTLVPYVVEESVQQCVVSAAGAAVGRQLVAGGGRGNMWFDHQRGNSEETCGRLPPITTEVVRDPQ